MKHRKTSELFLYWNRLRGDRPAPRRTDVEPADIKELLADTFILEEDSRGNAVFRLSGTRLCAAYGRELKGFVFSSLWPDKDQRLVDRLVRDAFHKNTITTIRFEGATQSGRTTEFELIVLPVTSDDGGARALGLIASLDLPFWLGADPVLANRTQAVRVIDPDREPMYLKNRPEVPLPMSVKAPALDPSAGDDPAREVDRPRRVRHLMVLEGGLRD